MQTAQPEGYALSARTVLLGSLVVIGFTAAGCFSVFLRYEIIGTGYLPRGAVAILLLMVLASAVAGAAKGARRGPAPDGNGVATGMSLPRRQAARAGIEGRRAILAVFIMLLAVGGIAGQEYAQHVYLNLLGIVYYATPDIARPELYLDDLNPVLVPSKDRLSPEVRWAYEGVPPGQRIPYGAWVRPLLVWTPYFLAVYWMLLCFAAILAPRWEDHERLLYPLMQVPTDLTDLSKGPVPALLRNPLMWVCFGISCALYVVKGLHTYYPSVPDIDLQRTTESLFGGGPAVAFNNVALHIYPEMIGIAYLLTSEVGFSMWFFYVFRLLQAFARNLLGITTSHYACFEFQTAGGYLVLGLALLWSARKHLAGVFGEALGTSSGESRVCAPFRAGDPRPHPTRLAVLGFLAALAFIIIWAAQVGMSVGWALLLFGLLPLVGMVVARVICEAGMFIYSSPFRLNELIFNIAGTRTVGARNITLMTAVSWLETRATATQFLPSAFQGLKLASIAGLNRTPMLLVMMLGITLAVLTCHVASLYVIYTWGVPKLGWWPKGSGLGATTRLVSFIANPTVMRPADWGAIAGGGALTMLLVAMRQRFLWWPFHPAGYVAFLGWPIERYWLSILLGWLAKWAVLRVFGYKTFAAGRPMAFGFILGICFIMTFWLVFHFFVAGPPLLVE